MAAITLSETPSSAIDPFDETKLQPNTNTGFISVVFSSTTRVIASARTPVNYNINNLDVSDDQPYQKRRPQLGFLRGRRPNRGLLFPRGYYNK